MAKPRKQTYTMDMYLRKIREQDIRNDADVQRQFVWNNEQINEIIVTILTDDYIPPIILGEEDNSQLWIVDGGQRSGAFRKYRYGNYKITSSVENSVIPYKAKIADEQGHVMKDRDGNIIWEETTFNIKNKTYEQLPDELKKKFNEYQVETVIHEHCDSHRISQLIKRYNNHTSMNTNQKAFTYIDNFAREIREILDSKFFIDCSNFKETEKNKGVLERVVVETVMCMNHLDDWKKQTRAICNFLNKNATKDEFKKLADNLHRLECVISSDIKDVFNSKDSFVFLTLFNKFTDLGCDDSRFADFLRAFKERLKDVEVDGKLFSQVDKCKGTKDKTVINTKLDILTTLMFEYLQVVPEDLQEVDILDFIHDNVNSDIQQEDIALHEDNLKAWTIAIPEDARIHEKRNKPSMVAFSAYVFENDELYDDETIIAWFAEYNSRHSSYLHNQKDNFLLMKEDLKKYMVNNQKTA